MALQFIPWKLLNKAMRQGKTHINLTSILGSISKRMQSVDAATIIERSPYEEINAKLDSRSTKKNPMKINAYGNERTIACVCDDMHFMTLKKGPPVKCKCGYWFELVDANKFWEKEIGSS